jgi:hypothetical protein
MIQQQKGTLDKLGLVCLQGWVINNSSILFGIIFIN